MARDASCGARRASTVRWHRGFRCNHIRSDVNPANISIICASSNEWYSGTSNLQGVRDPTKSDDLSPNSALNNINALPVTKSICGLLGLSNELLDMIFHNLEIEQVFVLGLQSQNLWNVARKHIRASLASSCGLWAGNRIMCVGEYLESEDYPPSVLTESEEAEFKDGRFEHFGSSLYDLADARYQEVREWQPDLANRLIDHASSLGEWHRLPESSQSRIRDDLLSDKLSDLYPEDQPWVLRNLTTQEYVRSEAIAIKPEHIHGPNIDVLGFGHVVCSRVCWSAADWSEDRGIHRGVWAGHRFDITTLDRLKQGSMESSEWKDVSEEVWDEMEIEWTERLGSDWCGSDWVRRNR